MQHFNFETIMKVFLTIKEPLLRTLDIEFSFYLLK
jgi:hypothetical protein